MAARPPKRPRQRPQLQTGTLISDDAGAISRHLSELGSSLRRVDGALKQSVTVTATLVAGANRITHGLGHAPRSVHVTLSSPDATFSAALTSADDRQAVVTTVGATATDASLRFE